ncbi:lytic transglycosylase domain-containing protein [Sphingobium sp. CR2-8]|uniref:lytic transglycosylase domain-containing protein n=1 Tax=Sphingobium sp. CR2-8 TaxID=1306534 RepID=UPI002DBD5564|nr:lytic transglycosylase domain-containing protein [Sphingobium sp. CR2-8]MEC3909639.1 lytic transglycosylase domain-containing protein [Sphingobium sp. CR2-8]
MLLIASHRPALIGICLLMAWPDVGFALPSRPVARNEVAVARCIHQAAPGQVWLEKTLWGFRDQEGGWLGAEIQNSDGSHDLGPFQINSWWVPKLAYLLHRPPAQVRIWLRDNPCFNAEAARWIFLSALRLTRDYWRAVGVYHSPRASRQRRYASDVAMRLTERVGPAIFRLYESVDR